MTEAELQAAVVEVARLLGWRVAHFRPAQTRRGWRTPVTADGAGFPDLVLTNGRRVVYAELKAERGHLSPLQEDWLDDLRSSGCEVFVWRPRDWHEGTIERVLRAARREFVCCANESNVSQGSGSGRG